MFGPPPIGINSFTHKLSNRVAPARRRSRSASGPTFLDGLVFYFPRTVDKSFKLFTALRAVPPKASNVEIDAASIKIGRCLRGALALYCFVSARAGSMAHTYKTQVLGGAFRIFSGTSLGV
jgi:hypothetical protein